MSQAEVATQSLFAYQGDMFTVIAGANLGDGISFAADMVLDDLYCLSRVAEPARIDLKITSQSLTILETSEHGRPGAEIRADACITLMAPDGSTAEALVLVELDSTAHVRQSYVVPLAHLAADTDYALVGMDTDEVRSKLALVACVAFIRGTRITLHDGRQMPIEDLSVGDRVLTRHAGAQPVRWIGQSTLRATGAFAPVRIKAGTLNNTRDLIVSPEHRLFIYQRSDAIGAGRRELLVKARHLVNGVTVTVEDGGFVDYFQLAFDEHQIIYAEGIAAESFLIDTRTAPAIPDAVSARLGNTGTARRGMAGLDVSRKLLDRPDAVELLRRASSS